EVRFWAAVEREDPEALVAALGLEGDGSLPGLESMLPALASWRRRRREVSAVDAWRYGVRWLPLAVGAGGGVLDGVWLVVTGEGVPGEV
ncbi:hypothetical protein, partial [Streptomyces sp. HPF1205]|uniref:hypothetical protein n=1 Tax=Streptomyces sp. HPF1205 TaxID=2873262 RepID=UPI001CED363D